MTRAAPALDQRVDDVLEIEHVGRAVGQVLVVHAVVGGQDDDRAGGVERADVAVDHRVERVGGRRAGRRLVLNVVGRRQIHDVRAERRLSSLTPAAKTNSDSAAE